MYDSEHPESPKKGPPRAPMGLSDEVMEGYVKTTTRLAEDLVRGEMLSEDAVQDIALASISRPPVVRSTPARWFQGAMKRRVLHLRRGEGMRRQRERLVAGEERRAGPEEPHEALVRTELRERLVAAVMSLPEPYRTPIVLRYLEQQSVQEVALELNRPKSTVESQLGRGLKQLRERLASELGEDGRDWRLALAPIVGMPVLRGAAGANATATAAGALPAAGMIVAALLVAAIGYLTLRWARSTSPTAAPVTATAQGSESEHRTPGAAEVPATDSPKREDELGSTETVPAVEPVDLAAEFSTGVPIEVVSAADGSPLAGTTIYVDRAASPWVDSAASEEDRASSVETDVDGRAIVEIAKPAWIRVERQGYVPVLRRLSAGPTEANRPERQALQKSATLRVSAPADTKLISARVRLAGRPTVALPHWQMTPSGDGSMSISLAPGRYVVSGLVSRSGLQSADAAVLNLVAGGTHSWQVLDPDEATIEVHLAGAFAPKTRWMASLLIEGDSPDIPPTRARTGDALRIESVPAGSHTLVAALDGVECYRVPVNVPARGLHTVELNEELGSLTIDVTRIDTSGPPPLVLAVGPLGSPSMRDYRGQGKNVRFDSLPRGTYEVWTRGPGGVGRTLAVVGDQPAQVSLPPELGAGARLTYTGKPPMSRHDLTVVAESGAAIPLTLGLDYGAASVLRPNEEVAGEQESTAGSLTFALPPGRYELLHTVDGYPRASRELALNEDASVSVMPGDPLSASHIVLTRRGQPVASEAIDLIGYLVGRAPHDVRPGPLYMQRALTDQQGRLRAELSRGLWYATLAGGAGAAFSIEGSRSEVLLELVP